MLASKMMAYDGCVAKRDTETLLRFVDVWGPADIHVRARYCSVTDFEPATHQLSLVSRIAGRHAGWCVTEVAMD